MTPAQTLMLIVPADSLLEIEAMISNRDIGFVEGRTGRRHQGRYLQLHPVWPAARQDIVRFERCDRARQAAGNGRRQGARGAESSSSEPKGLELVYSARISVDRTQMDDRRQAREPVAGHGGECRSQDGYVRTIISYLLSPLARYRHDSMRER